MIVTKLLCYKSFYGYCACSLAIVLPIDREDYADTSNIPTPTLQGKKYFYLEFCDFMH